MNTSTLVAWMSGTILQYDPSLYDLNTLKFNQNLLKTLTKKYSRIIFIIKYKDQEEQELLKDIFKKHNLQAYQFVFIDFNYDTDNIFKALQNSIGDYDYLDSSRPRLSIASQCIGVNHTMHISQFLN